MASPMEKRTKKATAALKEHLWVQRSALRLALLSAQLSECPKGWLMGLWMASPMERWMVAWMGHQ